MLVEIGSMDLSAARSYLHQRVETLQQKSGVTLIGFSLENRVAIFLVPRMFVFCTSMLLTQLLRYRSLLSTLEETATPPIWAPMFPGLMGLVATIAAFCLFPLATSAVFARRVVGLQLWPVAVALVALGCALSIATAHVLTLVNKRFSNAQRQHREKSFE